MNWYYSDQGQQKGPIDDSALNELVVAGVVQDNTLVWREGMASWQTHAAARGSASVPAVPITSASEAGYCGECGRPFPANELVAIGPVSVCAVCKPAYLQKLREGGAAAVGSRRYAGFWIRVAARVVDAILLNVVFLAVRIPLGAAIATPGVARGPGALAATAAISVFIVLLSLIVGACYEIFLIAKRGATIGKMVFGVKVIRPDGSPIPLGLSTGRYFAQYIDGFTLGIGYIMAGFDNQKRALHDRICETRVVYSR